MRGDLATKATLPAWLKIRPPSGELYQRLRQQVESRRLTTVCEEARCPNLSECWSSGTATLMLMGEVCTRGCRFCSVKTAREGLPLDPEEPAKVVETVQTMGLSYVVLTSVDRDDLEDGGAGHFAATVRRLKADVAGILVETLMSDFQGDEAALSTLAASGADVLAHNLETIRRLTPRVRDPRCGYDLSLKVLQRLKQLGPDGTLTKSSLMLGLGESDAEIEEALADLRAADVDLVTLGQYLRPSARHLEVVEYLPPEKFLQLQEKATELGFLHVAAGPFVRSSYKAGELFTESYLREKREALKS